MGRKEAQSRLLLIPDLHPDRLACRGTAPPVDEVLRSAEVYSLGIVQGGQG